MEIEGREISHVEHGGPKWEKEMMALDKEAIVKILQKKIEEADRYHDIAQTKIGKHMILQSSLNRSAKCCKEQRETIEKDKVVRNQLVDALKEIKQGKLIGAERERNWMKLKAEMALKAVE